MILLQIFASTGLGLLIGILLGLSNSPVVGLVVGAIASLMASFLGLVGATDKAPAELDKIQMQTYVRAGVFGFACLVGVFSGIYTRTHNLLSPPDNPLQTYYSQLLAIGFTSEEARHIAANLPTAAATKPNEEAGVADSVLFATNLEECEKLSAENFATAKAFINYLENAGLKKYVPIAQVVDNSQLNEQQKVVLMNKLMEALCAQH